MKRLFPLVFFFLISPCFAQENAEKHLFRYPDDNAFDVSGFLSTKVGFLPVPIIITEPALGYGGGINGLYFHTKGEEQRKRGSLPPSISFLGGGGTSNKTWFTFAGHFGSYWKDRLRYTGVVSFVSPRLSFFKTFLGSELSVLANIEGFMTFHEFLFRPN